VIRYDLRGVAKPLTSPFADPSDKTGATALTEIPAQIGQYYPLHNFDIKVLETGYADALGETVPEEANDFSLPQFPYAMPPRMSSDFTGLPSSQRLSMPMAKKSSGPNPCSKPHAMKPPKAHSSRGRSIRLVCIFRCPKM
jgi:hypothetical protein